ncbi:MAG: GDP-mannose 4,6-dehydratase [Flavobacterium sp.]|nr:GDP-mannose 4,6-dehydratase [Flavobacterium sp.]
MKRAIIVGSQGQDGQLLYDFLLKRRYSIVGINKNQIKCSPGISFKKPDIFKIKEVANLVKKFQPREIYYLAAFHHSSEDLPSENVELLRRSYKVHVAGLLNFLESVKIFCPKARFFYAASSHVFGEAKEKIQNENTPINPNCIYGITKAAGLALCRFYRLRYDIFSAVGILYNHESVLRSRHFVSKKIIQGAINIKKGIQKKLVLGNLNAVIDWGYAPDYVRAMHLILNSKTPNDFIIATGKPHTVLDFVKVAFEYLGLNWKLYVKEDPHIVCKQNFFCVGNPRNLIKNTGWKPKVNFKEMIKIMINEELDIFLLK